MAILVVRDGIPVELDDRLWSFDATPAPVAPNAYVGGITLDPDEIWRTQRAVRTIVGFIARNFAQVGVHAFELDPDGDRRRLDRGHVLSATLDAPDDTATQFDLLHQLAIDLSLWERWAARIVETEDGVQLVRLPPRTWSFERDNLRRPTAICGTNTAGQKVTWPLAGFAWLDGYPCGADHSPLGYLTSLLAEETASANYRAELWRNGARMGGWVSRPPEAPEWSTKARDNWRSGWQEYAADGVRAGKTPLLEEGMEYHELQGGITPESAQQLESRKFSLAEAAAAFFLPAVFVGLLDETTYANVRAFREVLYSDTLGPWFQRVQQAFNARLLTHPAFGITRGSAFVEFNVMEKLRLAFEDQAKILQTLVGAPMMSRNEGRRRVNLPAIDGGDDLVTPLNVLIGGQASPTDSAAPMAQTLTAFAELMRQFDPDLTEA